MKKPNLNEAIKHVLKAIRAARRRRDIDHFDEEKNYDEMMFDINYRLNPPLKTKRKEEV